MKKIFIIMAIGAIGVGSDVMQGMANDYDHTDVCHPRWGQVFHGNIHYQAGRGLPREEEVMLRGVWCTVYGVQCTVYSVYYVAWSEYELLKTKLNNGKSVLCTDV